MKEILIKPQITEKSITLAEESKYVFEVGKLANKPEIKKAVEDYYKVNVISVNVSHRKPKARRYGKTKGFKPGSKIAVVTLKPDQKIELFEQAK